jgi:hypothetical protein
MIKWLLALLALSFMMSIFYMTRKEAQAATATRAEGQCLAQADKAGYETFCSQFPVKEACVAQGDLCRWAE